MPTLLFKLRHVPDDEAEEVRDLLQAHNIEFYETTAGTWGISLPALWLHHDKQLEEGKRLISDYQQTRAQDAQSMYQKQCQSGEQRTICTLIQESPFKFFGYVFAILFMLYLVTVPVTFLFH